MVLLAFALPAHADALDEVMRNLAQVKSARGKFVERKHLAMLDGPLESSGILAFSPDRLEKHMLAPHRESMVVERDTLILEKDGKRRVLALQENAVAWGLIESIRSTLRGDLATLKRFYGVRLEGDPADWRLLLTPLEGPMRKAAREIRIGGKGGWVERIEVIDAAGDRSVTVITREGS